MNENCTKKPTEGEPTSQYKENNSCGFRPSGAWLQSDGLLTATEIAQLVNLTQDFASLNSDCATTGD